VYNTNDVKRHFLIDFEIEVYKLLSPATPGNNTGLRKASLLLRERSVYFYVVHTNKRERCKYSSPATPGSHRIKWIICIFTY